MWSRHPLRYKQLRIYLLCLVLFLGVSFTRTFLRLQFKVIGSSTEPDEFRVPRQSTLPLKSGVVVEDGFVSTTSGSRTTSLAPPLHSNKVATETNGRIVPNSNGTNESWNPHNSRSNHNNSTAAAIAEFTRQEGVVIVSKVHGPHQLALFKQSMCLLHHAYNHKVRYDIVLFTTIPIPDNEPLLVETRAMIAPVTLKVVLDNEGIVQEIQKLSPKRRQNFLDRCNVTSPEQITWDSECYEEGAGVGQIRYNWQAEFRSWHIWHHQSLKSYRYMLWMDTDAFCTKVWDRDPIALAMKHEMAIYFDNYPQGRSKAAQSRVKEAFGTFICRAKKSSNGPLTSTLSDDCEGAQLWTIHGFTHVTDLNFYRQKKVMQWAEIMIGDCFLCRQFDDQLAVTVPPVVLAPERAWDMYKSGVELEIYHNAHLDGKRKKRVGDFRKYWNQSAELRFPEAWNKCVITEGS